MFVLATTRLHLMHRCLTRRALLANSSMCFENLPFNVYEPPDEELRAHCSLVLVCTSRSNARRRHEMTT